MLICYGGFGSHTQPRYQPDLLARILAGGKIALAAVHAAADWLTEAGHVHPGGLVLNGGSHGGLLVAGAVVQRPHAYAAAAIGAAPLDMIRYERSGLGALWTAEYGSAEDPDAFPEMLRLSPYHTIDDAATYPPMLFYTGANDTRVDPLHSRKMVAALQHGGTGPIVHHVVPDMGHRTDPGAAARELSATILAFLAHHAGLDLTADAGGVGD